jgi:hypothetical protein
MRLLGVPGRLWGPHARRPLYINWPSRPYHNIVAYGCQQRRVAELTIHITEPIDDIREDICGVIVLT